MKKLLFMMFASVVATLAGATVFLSNTDTTYAAACPDTDPTCNDGICGDADGERYWQDTTIPSSDRCQRGTPTNPTWNGNSWDWTCRGNNPDGADKSCGTAGMPTTGICGSANGHSFFGAPESSSLCGGASILVGAAPTGTGPWSWSCKGTITNSTCNAQVDTRTFSWEISARGACYETSTGTCSGTYQAAGACGGEGQRVGGSVDPLGGPNGPREGMLCRSFTTELSCNGNGSPWSTHPCHWRDDAYRTESCSDFLTNNSCSANSGCNWNQNPGQQVQNRSVVCKDNTGAVVADSFCGYPEPATTQNGTTESCNPGGQRCLDITHPGGCFIADTLVTLADGSTKDIQDIQVGDILKGVTSNNTVLSLLRPLLGDQDIYAINGEEGFFTANHPFLTTDGWKSLDPETTKKEISDLDVTLLEIGDVLIREEGKIIVATIDAVQKESSTQLYNFELDGDHTYYANGYAVHNKNNGDGLSNNGASCTYHSDCWNNNYYVNEKSYCDDATKVCTPTEFYENGVLQPGREPVLAYHRYPNNIRVPTGTTPDPTKVSCTATDGVCGTTEQTCTVGTIANYNPTTHTWQCIGTNNGTTAQCSFTPTPVVGVCGTANNGSYSSAPTNNLCQSGTASTVSGTGPWSWSCNGSNGGGNASCNANIAPVHAMCGTANGIPTSATPSGASLCQIGLPLPVSGPSGNPASFTWSCMGLYGGNNVPCSAPYQGTACVAYDSVGIHAGLNVNITPNDNIKAVFLNHPENRTDTEQGIIYTTSGSYSFTGPISATQDLKVTITNLATFAEPTSRAQFIQFREINSNSTAGKFYGNLAGWNVINPLALLHNQANANNGMQVDAGDLNRGWIYPNNPASQFVAWNKATRGFNVTMQVCSTSNPYPITRNASCDAIPAHTIYNTTSTIVQTQASSGAAWLPSTTSVYNTTASTTECRFVCESGYNWNGSACVQNVTYSWDIGTWSGVCPDTQQTRPVVCKDNNGNTVADSFCTTPKPATTQPLTCNTTCGGYSHIYLKRISENQTRNDTRTACPMGGDGYYNEYTCTYGLYQDAAGTIIANVSNLIGNFKVDSYGNGFSNSTNYPLTINGATFTNICRTEEQEFFDATCYQGGSTTIPINNSCITVIDESNPPQQINGSCKTFTSPTYTSCDGNGGQQICITYEGFSYQPGNNTSNACQVGLYFDIADDNTYWKWECRGSGGGTTAVCEAEKERPVSAQCDSYTEYSGGCPRF